MSTTTIKPLNVTLISGFLGSGKTSLLKHVLQNREGIRCAVIVNEITEENIDAYALGGTKLLRDKEQFVEMPNGCICCTLRADLLKQLRELAATNLFDSVLIESSGISEPMQVAQTFMTDLEDGLGPLNNVARLDTCVTVIDASTILTRLREQPHGEENIGQLLVQQIEFANVVILNKIDVLVDDTGSSSSGRHHHHHQDEKSRLDSLVQHQEVQTLMRVITQMNPSAVVIPTMHSKVSLSNVLNTGLCTEEYAASVNGWMTEIAEAHTPETEEYGVVNYVFRSKKPFHPLRLYEWLTSMWLLAEMGGEDDDDEDEECVEGMHGAESDSDDHDNEEMVGAESDGRKGESGAGQSKPAPTLENISSRYGAGGGGNGGAQQAAPTDTAEFSMLKQQKDDARKERMTRYGGEIFRCKGFVWVGNCSRLGFYVTVNGAGDLLTFLPGGGWDAFPERGGGGTQKIEPCQMLAFLGQHLNKKKLQADLEELLLTDAEMEELKKAMLAPLAADGRPREDVFDDPFGSFGHAHADDDDDEDGEHAECDHAAHSVNQQQPLPAIFSSTQKQPQRRQREDNH